MISKKERIELDIVQNNLAKIRKGDKVRLVHRPEIDRNCLEAEYHGNEIFDVLDDARKMGGTWCVEINRYGWFDILFLEKVEPKGGSQQ